MLIYKLLISTVLFFNILGDSPDNDSLFISPLKIPVSLSANFGELRIDHFHSGVDIKTQGVTGKEVVAAADGYVYRISVSPGGFGKALYLIHPSGYSTVYAHLDSFTQEIEDYVKDQQYERKSYQVTLFPSKEKFPVSQGELIAYSGNSGSSGGPHLHYEIRKAGTEKPVNPLLFKFDANDDVKPVIEKLVIYPINENTLINKNNRSKKIAVAGDNGKYYISGENEIIISGLAGFGIKSYDRFSDSYNKCSAYSIELKIDSVTRFRYLMNEFSFSESRYINSHIDYETLLRENTYIERTFILPNDKLSLYHDVIDRGIFDFCDNKVHRVQIVLTDAHKNRSTLDFKVKSQYPAVIPLSGRPRKEGIVMPYNRSNKFRAENILVSIPSGTFYDTVTFTYKRDNGTPMMLSDVHYVHNKFTPVHKAYSLSIKPSVIPAGKESKLLIVGLSDDYIKSGLKSSFANGFVTGDALSFGMFYVGIDTIPPSISVNGLMRDANLSGKSEIRIKITDDLSGIKSYEASVDSSWALFEFDQKNNVLIYRFDPDRISKGSKHSLSLKVTDNKENKSLYSCDFIW